MCTHTCRSCVHTCAPRPVHARVCKSVHQTDVHAHTRSWCSPIAAVSALSPLSAPLRPQGGRSGGMSLSSRLGIEVQKERGLAHRRSTAPPETQVFPRAHLSLTWPHGLCGGIPPTPLQSPWGPGQRTGVFRVPHSSPLSPQQDSLRPTVGTLSQQADQAPPNSGASSSPF